MGQNIYKINNYWQSIKDRLLHGSRLDVHMVMVALIGHVDDNSSVQISSIVTVK